MITFFRICHIQKLRYNPSHMDTLQGHSVTEKLSCGRSQYEVMSEKTSYEQNVSYLSDKESLMEVGNFTQKMANYMKICFSQNICHEGTDVFSCSHDDSLNEEDTALVGKEHDTVKLKHIISLH